MKKWLRSLPIAGLVAGIGLLPETAREWIANTIPLWAVTGWIGLMVGLFFLAFHVEIMGFVGKKTASARRFEVLQYWDEPTDIAARLTFHVLHKRHPKVVRLLPSGELQHWPHPSSTGERD